MKTNCEALCHPAGSCRLEPCSSPAKVERDDKSYCLRHDPDKKKARYDKKIAKQTEFDNAKLAIQRQQQKIEDIRQQKMDAAEEMYNALNMVLVNLSHNDKLGQETISAMEKAVKLAETCQWN